MIKAGATVGSDATASGSLDTLGYRYAVIDVMVSTSATASHTLTALVLSHQTSAATGGTALATGGTDFTIPTSNVTTPLASFRVDLNGRHRYLALQATPGTSAYVNAIAHLYRAAEVPVTATKAGVGVLHSI
jgi:hypothetical protein